PKPISETRSSVFPICRYSTVVPPHPQLQRDIIPEMADKQQYVTEPPCAPQPNVHRTPQLSFLYGLCYHRPRLCAKTLKRCSLVTPSPRERVWDGICRYSGADYRLPAAPGPHFVWRLEASVRTR